MYVPCVEKHPTATYAIEAIKYHLSFSFSTLPSKQRLPYTPSDFDQCASFFHIALSYGRQWKLTDMVANLQLEMCQNILSQFSYLIYPLLRNDLLRNCLTTSLLGDTELATRRDPGTVQDRRSKLALEYTTYMKVP